VGPFHLDPQRCISYWTIETQEPIPHDLRPAFGNRIFGCDVCQSVCPWNQRLPAERRVDALFAPAAGLVAPRLLDGFEPESPYWLDEAVFAARFADSPILRSTRAGMLRNVSVALGNGAAVESIPALALALNDAEAAPRGHAAWALGRIADAHAGATDQVHALLARREEVEENSWVQAEIRAARHS
jgi:epoxyqueuosine reductase